MTSKITGTKGAKNRDRSVILLSKQQKMNLKPRTHILYVSNQPKSASMFQYAVWAKFVPSLL